MKSINLECWRLLFLQLSQIQLKTHTYIGRKKDPSHRRSNKFFWEKHTLCNCWRIYPFSQTSWETCFCRRSFSSINSLFIAVNFLFTVCSREDSFRCFSRHLHQKERTVFSSPKKNTFQRKKTRIFFNYTNSSYHNSGIPKSKNHKFKLHELVLVYHL